MKYSITTVGLGVAGLISFWAFKFMDINNNTRDNNILFIAISFYGYDANICKFSYNAKKAIRENSLLISRTKGLS